ncbi:MAG: replication-relaxation family protein [Planctomycetia bacterium]|nr:replication-relaxation family protein [Planctomycetia bacterium]
MNVSAWTRRKRRRPLTPWELPSLVTPVHRYRCRRLENPKERPHFAAILAWVYRNRFAVASQIQRRFAKYLKSGRTARRQLQELESLGWLGVAPARAVGPLFPKVYYVTRSGVQRIKEAFKLQGKTWEPTRVDRKGWHSKAGYSAEHVIHELLLTEFLLGIWKEFAVRTDVKLLQVERRSLGRQSAFALPELGKSARLRPDAMFTVENGHGFIAFLVELDLGTMSRKQVAWKLRRYAVWMTHGRAARWVKSVARGRRFKERAGELRIVWIVKSRVDGDDTGRLAEIVRAARPWFDELHEHVWCATVGELATASSCGSSGGAGIWIRWSDLRARLRSWRSSELICTLEALGKGTLVPGARAAATG